MSFPAAQHVIDIGSPDWCWRCLGTRGEGSLSFEAWRGRISLEVPYVVTGGQIRIPVPSFNAPGWRAAGVEARLEVTGLTPDHLRWVVRVTGIVEQAELVGPSQLAFSRRMHPANGVTAQPAGTTAQLVLLAPRVRGFYVTGLATDPGPVGSSTPDLT
jgi:hypothetical protein